MSRRRKAESLGLPDAGARWTRTEGERVVAAWAKSGESMLGFAQRHGFSCQRLAWWRSKVNDSATERSLVGLTPVVLRASAGGCDAVVTVEISDAVRVHVRDIEQAPSAWVASLVCALGRAER